MLKTGIEVDVNADDLPPFDPQSFDLSAEDEPGQEQKNCGCEEKKKEKKKGFSPKVILTKLMEEGTGKKVDKWKECVVEKAEKIVKAETKQPKQTRAFFKDKLTRVKSRGKQIKYERRVANAESKIAAAEEKLAASTRFARFITSPLGGGIQGAAWKAGELALEGKLNTQYGAAEVALAAVTGTLTALIVGMWFAETAPVWLTIGAAIGIGFALDKIFEHFVEEPYINKLPGGEE